jgi:hypothetical protein
MIELIKIMIWPLTVIFVTVLCYYMRKQDADYKTNLYRLEHNLDNLDLKLETWTKQIIELRQQNEAVRSDLANVRMQQGIRGV